MSQISLFAPSRAEAAPAAPDLDFIRKHLGHLVRLVRRAERMPWSEAETASWEKRFPALAAYLPAEEGEALQATFAAELARLRSA